MKKIISLVSLLLTAVLLLTMVTVSPLATSGSSDETLLKDGLGRCYKFSYGADGDRYAYEMNASATYKGNTFYPMWGYTDRNAQANVEYKAMSDGGEGSTDVLRFTATGSTYFTPLTADGKPFEVEPGKEYVVRMDAYIEVETDWSHVMAMLGSPNVRCDSWSESYANNSKALVKGIEGAAKAEDLVYGSPMDANRPFSCRGFGRNNGNTWATGVIGDTTSSAYHLQMSRVFAVPDPDDTGVEMTAEYNSQTDSLSFGLPMYKNSDLTSIKDSDGDGVQDVRTLNNYLCLFFSGGTTKDEEGNTVPFTYSIKSIEIWENNYQPDIELIVNGQVESTILGADRSVLKLHVPSYCPEGQIFTGWYTDSACTDPVDRGMTLGATVTKLYAGYKTPERSNLVMTPADCMSAKVYYPLTKDITTTKKDEAGNVISKETEKDVYKGILRQHGWSFSSNDGQVIKYDGQASWGQVGTTIVADKRGVPFIVNPKSYYTITIEYKIDDIIRADEVTLPENRKDKEDIYGIDEKTGKQVLKQAAYNYTGGSIQLSVGVGFSVNNVYSIDGNRPNSLAQEGTLTFKDDSNTDWQTATFTIYTGEMEGEVPFMSYTVNCGALPKKYNADGSYASDQYHNYDFGHNALSVRKVTVEEYPTPFIIFDAGTRKTIAGGSVGARINQPNNAAFGASDITWYADKEFKKTFNFNNTFAAGDRLTAYSGTSVYDFEDEPTLKHNQGWFEYSFTSDAVVEDGIQTSGTHSFRIDRDPDKNKNDAYVVLQYGGVKDRTHFRDYCYKLDNNRKYIMTFMYYVAKQGKVDAKFSAHACHQTSFWGNSTTVSDQFIVPITDPTGVWRRGAFVVDGTKIKDANYESGNNVLYLKMQKGTGAVIYVDDITVTVLPEGQTGYYVDNGGCSAIPQYVTGSLGASFANQLPEAPSLDNYFFKGYYAYDAGGNKKELPRSEMVFSEEKMRIQAGFVRLMTNQDFENDSYRMQLSANGDYGVMDFDYELYDSTAEGNSPDNVTSGKYSLHRKGNTCYFENAQVLSQDLMLTNSDRYTLTMKVKLGKHFQTDGAVKFVNCRSPYYGWGTTGEYYAIAPIKDLLDGQWHEVSYTFNSVEAFIAIQTPGYCEIFVDDIVIERVDENTPLSVKPKYTEYVQAQRDANGNLIKKNVSDIDITSIIDASLYMKNGGVNWLLIGLIGGGALVVIGAGLAVFFILRGRKRKTA